MAEPPQASRHRLQLKYWGGAIGALETLLLRAGSLESVLTSAEPVLDGARLYEILGETSHALQYIFIASFASPSVEEHIYSESRESVLTSAEPVLDGARLCEILGEPCPRMFSFNIALT